MKRVAGTPWGNVVIDTSIKPMDRGATYLQGKVWNGYAGWMNLTDMSTEHLQNLERFLAERQREVLASARQAQLRRMLDEPVDYYELDVRDFYIDTFDDVPFVVALRQQIASRLSLPSSEELSLERHVRWLDSEIEDLKGNRARSMDRLIAMRRERLSGRS
jgi:hypothetical protein